VCGNYEGTIRFYDFNFKIVAWFEDCLFSNVKSISFSNTAPKPCNNEYYNQEKKDKDDEIFMCSDFLVGDDNALICMLQSSLFEEIEPSKKKGYTIMHGIKSAISAIAVHPTQSILAIAGSDGFILLWDYIKKGDPISNYENFNKELKKGEDFKYFTAIEFTPDGNEILVATYNGDIKLMDSQTA